MSKIRIKLVKSGIDRPLNQKRTLKALGLTKLNKTVEHEATPSVKGMVHTVQHLIEVTEI